MHLFMNQSIVRDCSKDSFEKSSYRVLIEKYAMICQADFEKFPFYDINTFWQLNKSTNFKSNDLTWKSKMSVIKNVKMYSQG